MRNLFPVFVALPLLACTPAGDKADTGEAIAQGAGVGDGPSGRVGRPVAKGAEKGPIPANINEGLDPPAANEAEVAAGPVTIPAAFRGRWGINAADCEGGAAAKGLLTIEDKRLVFYESRGTLDRVTPSQSPDRFVASYRFTGEGQQWVRTEALTVAGNRLERRADPVSGQSEPVTSLTYTRCAG